MWTGNGSRRGCRSAGRGAGGGASGGGASVILRVLAKAARAHGGRKGQGSPECFDMIIRAFVWWGRRSLTRPIFPSTRALGA